ncbi:hypothetical protein Phi19:1_gp110 [Cellulophaga phage phi19:1]|uniref:Uncharacterized protein n=1 Tax=Cellulophaga phage phi19:1 TaxID=1327970 RepID=R9ZXZ3_9CAUD|nr:hypothetical protein Phi19:1_gp110 [Cellulophaga phage phi19:1]AGO47400.1 hypothetical protein Phi19:1_gp110 [Cellulophaga phage phi19:1]
MTELNEKLEQLVNDCMGAITFNIKQNIDASVIPASKEVALICINKQLEILRYLGIKDPKELYEDLVEQKRLLKHL